MGDWMGFRAEAHLPPHQDAVGLGLEGWKRGWIPAEGGPWGGGWGMQDSLRPLGGVGGGGGGGVPAGDS